MTAAQTEHPPRPLTRDEARELTDSIKRGVERTWGQLQEAFAGRAWVALEFPSWESYVRAEFGIGRSRSYQLLNQAKVIHEIADAADVHSVDINEATARDIKPRLSEVVEEVRAAVEDVPAAERPAVVADVVKDARERFIADRDTGEVLSSEDWAAANPVEPDAAPVTSPAPLSDPAPAAEAGRQPGAGEPAQEDWSPSDALDRRPQRRKAAASTSTRPPSIEEAFTDASRALHNAANAVERLTADPRFAARAKALADKHAAGISGAVEGLNIALIRLRGPSAANGGGGR